MKKIILIIISFTFFSTSYAQTVLEGEPDTKKFEGIDGAYKKDIRTNSDAISDLETKRKQQSYHHVREADVMWSTKIWRLIDMREKMNQIFYYPTVRIADRRSLIDVIMDAINLNLKDGNWGKGLQAYGPLNNPDDEFKRPLTKTELSRIGLDGDKESLCADMGGELIGDSCFVYDPELERPVAEDISKLLEFNTSKVHKWRVKEEWYFDKQRSVMDVRIIGLCPMKETERPGESGLEKSYMPLFWVYFPDARRFLKDAEIFNHRKNDAARMTFDDVFHKRFFSSYIYKESNKYNRQISQYRVGLDALLEAERIKEEIFHLEHDLWEY